MSHIASVDLCVFVLLTFQKISFPVESWLSSMAQSKQNYSCIWVFLARWSSRLYRQAEKYKKPHKLPQCVLSFSLVKSVVLFRKKHLHKRCDAFAVHNRWTKNDCARENVWKSIKCLNSAILIRYFTAGARVSNQILRAMFALRPRAENVTVKGDLKRKRIH